MRYIRTRNCVAIPKVLNRAAIAAQKTKEAVVAIKEKTDDVKNETAADYAADKTGEAMKYAEHRLERAFKKKRRQINNSSKGIKQSARAATRNPIRRRLEAQAARLRQFAARNMSERTKKAASALRKSVKVTWAVLKKIAQAAKALVSALIAGGSMAVAIIVLILLIGLLVASPFGIFLSGEAGKNGYSMKQTTAQLTEEYYDEIERIESRIAHDRVEVISSDGLTAINWKDVLAVYAVKTTSGQDGVDVATMDDRKLEILRGIMWDMNEIAYSTRANAVEIPVTVTNGDGEEVTELQTLYETILTIDLTHKTSEEAAAHYAFTSSQHGQLAELQSDEYSNMWVNLIGAYHNANGEIIVSDAEWIPTGFFSWPLPFNGDFNSGFGYRRDPFTGAAKFHGGIDLGAPRDTPILAAADGTVDVANSTDSWGYGYGYHVKIDHGNGYMTLYGHCNAVSVSPGQTVRQGQVIAYVGTTGNSTGNHLHFEVYRGGVRVDPLIFFAQ